MWTSRLINFKTNINLDYKIFYFILMATLFNEISILVLSFVQDIIQKGASDKDSRTYISNVIYRIADVLSNGQHVHFVIIKSLNIHNLWFMIYLRKMFSLCLVNISNALCSLHLSEDILIRSFLWFKVGRLLLIWCVSAIKSNVMITFTMDIEKDIFDIEWIIIWWCTEKKLL